MYQFPYQPCMFVYQYLQMMGIPLYLWYALQHTSSGWHHTTEHTNYARMQFPDLFNSSVDSVGHFLDEPVAIVWQISHLGQTMHTNLAEYDGSLPGPEPTLNLSPSPSSSINSECQSRGDRSQQHRYSAIFVHFWQHRWNRPHLRWASATSKAIRYHWAAKENADGSSSRKGLDAIQEQLAWTRRGLEHQWKEPTGSAREMKNLGLGILNSRLGPTSSFACQAICKQVACPGLMSHLLVPMKANRCEILPQSCEKSGC